MQGQEISIGTPARWSPARASNAVGDANGGNSPFAFSILFLYSMISVPAVLFFLLLYDMV